jgi:hypothetical protein
MSSEAISYSPEKLEAGMVLTSTYTLGFRLHYYPSSFFVFGLWLCYIVGMVALLDGLSQAKSLGDDFQLREAIVERMSTLFIQAHNPITAMVLARLAISALQNPATAPRTWTELFWLADRTWQGPIAVSRTHWSMLRRRIRPSSTFFFFSIASLIAFLTPYALREAWPATVVQATTLIPVDLNSFSPVAFNNIDSASQRATGEGAWTSGLGILDVYNSSTFLNASSPHSVSENAGEFFFAGDAINLGINAMPGIHLSGNCRQVQSPPLADNSAEAFEEWCQENGWDKYFSPPLTLQPGGESNLFLTTSWCSNYFANGTINNQWMNDVTGSFASIIAKVDGSDGTTDMDGFIQCDSSFITANGTVNTVFFQTFSSLEPSVFFDTSVPRQDIPVHPLFAAFFSFTETFGSTENLGDPALADKDRATSLFRALGYEGEYDQTLQSIQFKQANISTIATQFWVGASHMAAAITLLSRDDVHFDDAQFFSSVNGRKRNPPFIALTALALVSWLLIIVYCTIRMYRPTFGPSLDGYTAARLLADRPELVADNCCGDLEENERLRLRFNRVEDTRSDEPVGHIAVPQTVLGHSLDNRREYK